MPAAFVATAAIAEAASASDSSGATYKAKASGGPAAPWWWAQFVARHAAERQAREAAQREASAVIGDGWGVMPLPIGRGVAFHDPDEDVTESLAAITPFSLAA
jgi:hypothetical protein